MGCIAVSLVSFHLAFLTSGSDSSPAWPLHVAIPQGRVLESLLPTLCCLQSDLVRSHCSKYHTSNSQIYNFIPDLFSDSRLINLITYLSSLRLAHRHLKLNMSPAEFLISRQWPSIHTTPESWESPSMLPSHSAHSFLPLLSPTTTWPKSPLSLVELHQQPKPLPLLSILFSPILSPTSREFFKEQIRLWDSLYNINTFQKFVLRIYDKAYDLGEWWNKLLDENIFPLSLMNFYIYMPRWNYHPEQDTAFPALWKTHVPALSPPSAEVIRILAFITMD